MSREQSFSLLAAARAALRQLLDTSGNLAATVLVRKGTAIELNEVVLGDGELAIEEGGFPGELTLRIGDGVTAGGITSRGAFRFVNQTSSVGDVVVNDTTTLATTSFLDLGVVVALDRLTTKSFIGIDYGSLGESIQLGFPPMENGSYRYDFIAVPGEAIIPAVITKTTTGNPTDTVIGLICINTFDNNVRMYADGGWRTLATW